MSDSTVLKVVTYSRCYNFSDDEASTCSDKEAHLDIYRNLTILLAQAMGLPFHITYGNVGGVLLPDGNWTGMIRSVNRSEVDIAVAPFIVTVERSEAVSYASPFLIEDFTFVRRKNDFDSEMFALLHPFSASVWVSTAISLVLMILVHCLSFSWKVRSRSSMEIGIGKQSHHKSNIFLGNRSTSYSNITFDVVAALLHQPMAFIIKAEKMAEQIAVLSWIFATMVLTTCYVSVLLSFLTVPTSAGIRTIPELSRAISEGQYSCLALTGSSSPSMLSNSSSKEVKMIGESILRDPSGYGSLLYFLKNQDGVDRCFVEGRESIGFLQNTFFISEDSFFQTFQAFVTRKDFQYREKLELAIHRMAAAGLFQKAFKQKSFFVWLDAFAFQSGSGNYPRKLSLKAMGGVFIFLACGYCIAGVALLTEMAFSKLVRGKGNTSRADAIFSVEESKQRKWNTGDN